MKIIIATIKSWNIKRAKELITNDKTNEYALVQQPDELTLEVIQDFSPDFIFFPHWSSYIPKDIFLNYNCVVFHMTDLPYGRGGSPLQNLIVRGFKDTVISAVKVIDELDAGPIYLKEPLSLTGTAADIFENAADIIFFRMIPYIIENNPVPQPQTGEVYTFKRRKPDESELTNTMGIETVYDYIRMLDAEGYPQAYIDMDKYCVEFSNAQRNGDVIEAKAFFRRKGNV